MKSDYPSTIYPFWDNVGEGREKMDASKGRTHAVGCYLWGHLHYECALAEIKRLREALKTISEIENKDWGTDWEEIEEARFIADAAINQDTMPSTLATPA